MEDCIQELENGIFDYFIGDLERYASKAIEEKEMSFDDILEEWKDSYGSLLDSNMYLEFLVDNLLEPDYGISLKDLLSILKESKVSFSDYLVSLFRKKDTESIFADDGYMLSESTIFDILKKDDNEEDIEIDDEDAESVKKEIIKATLGEDNVDIDDKSGDEVDELFLKVSQLANISEKVDLIVSEVGTEDEGKLVESISKMTGMSLSEAKMVVEMV